ncbi:MAG: class I mannose-6-phosphate isomerase [Bacteroidales bacterium]|jgi:mannose-6-phosphate isomerase|nr:class I mannose-6-phosphate isomerase [Bacteroidales bacterium]
MLYPLKFKTVYKDKIWGGDKIRRILNKDFSPLPNCGETWEISGIEPSCSVVSNGFLAGNTLNELIEVYMGDLVGEKVFDVFGEEFPLLIKFIDAKEDLSIQVHPNDKMARQKHHANGKTEMWYIVDADPDARLNIGFHIPVNRQTVQKHMLNNSLETILRYIPIETGDAVFIPAGCVHAIGKGVLLAEIQQSSDITYRLYDYNRKDEQGNFRQLHIDDALDAINYQDTENHLITYSKQINTTSSIISNPCFATNYLHINKPTEKMYIHIDSFVIYICVSGKARIVYDKGEESMQAGECVLMPAAIESAVIVPNTECALLETYIP